MNEDATMAMIQCCFEKSEKEFEKELEKKLEMLQDKFDMLEQNLCDWIERVERKTDALYTDVPDKRTRKNRVAKKFKTEDYGSSEEKENEEYMSTTDVSEDETNDTDGENAEEDDEDDVTDRDEGVNEVNEVYTCKEVNDLYYF